MDTYEDIIDFLTWESWWREDFDLAGGQHSDVGVG